MSTNVLDLYITAFTPNRETLKPRQAVIENPVQLLTDAGQGQSGITVPVSGTSFVRNMLELVLQLSSPEMLFVSWLCTMFLLPLRPPGTCETKLEAS